MNKTELITYLRHPSRLSKEELEELEVIVSDHPYFLSARLLLAKASKEQDHPKTKKRVASAAIYSTDRILLKKYLNGNLFFLSEPPKPSTGETKDSEAEETSSTPASKPIPPKHQEQEKPAESRSVTLKPNVESKEEKGKIEVAKPKEQAPQIAPPKKTESSTTPTDQRKDVRPSAMKEKQSKPQPEIPELPSGELDTILEELQRDMENLKASRAKFAEVQQKIEEDDAVSSAIRKSSTESEPKKPEETKTPDSEAKTSEIEQDEARKSASEITRQILEAAKKAKEEVAREEKDLEDTKEAQPETAITKEEQKTEPEPEKIKDKPDTKSSDDDEKSKDAEKDEGEERAERVIREPRFSRFSTRSYLKPPKDVDPTRFLDEEKEEPKKDDKKTTPAESKEKQSSEESDDKIKLPDLSKAKPVARKNPRKSKSTEKTTEAKEDSSVKDSKEEETKTSKETKPKKEDKPKKEAKAKKGSTTKKKTSSEEGKKTSTKKKSATKKEPAKKKSKEKATKTTKEGGKKDDEPDRKSQQDIIDKFIKESPTIKYQRKEDMSAEDLAEQSAVWDPNLASEYLAEIYLHQGNKKRAIEIYEALSLKYPEKKSYFADLISKVE